MTLCGQNDTICVKTLPSRNLVCGGGGAVGGGGGGGGVIVENYWYMCLSSQR